jgi:hypothetical protein
VGRPPSQEGLFVASLLRVTREEVEQELSQGETKRKTKTGGVLRAPFSTT